MSDAAQSPESSLTTSPTGTLSSALSESPGPDPAPTPIAVRGESSRGRNGPRSRNGCWTCRTKKVKCDEKRPKCQRCVRLRLLCDYEPRAKRRVLTPKAKLPEITQQLVPVVANRFSGVPTVNNAAVRTHPWLKSLPAWASDVEFIPRRLSDVGSSASSLELTSADHEAIRYYRTTFAKHQHTKSSDFSMYSLMFNLAERDPMVMRSLLALGSREIQYRKSGPQAVESNPASWTAVRHYSEALRLMAATVGNDENVEVDTDKLLAGIFLLMLYEQKFGDAGGVGWVNHVQGAALVIQHRFHDWPRRINTGRTNRLYARKSSIKPADEGPQPPKLSLFAARILGYITVHDAAAATFGLGGQVNAVMHQICVNHDPDATPLDTYDRIHRYSHALYRTVWAENYPQKELLDDIENRGVFAMIGCCFMMRWMIADASMRSVEAAQALIPGIQAAIDQTTEQYGELLAVASELSVKTDGSQRIAVNLRAFVPYYYAILLEFRRLCKDTGTLDDSEGSGNTAADVTMHIRTIMTLSLHTYKHMGMNILQIVAWPLLIAALETDSQAHRDWILARFQNMGSYSRNYERAHRFLARMLDIQAQRGEKINILQQLATGEDDKFVL